MIDELEEEIEMYTGKASDDLELMGFDIEVVDSAFSTHIPQDKIAHYDPKEDTVYVSRNPLELSKKESVELMTEIQKQMLRGQSMDNERIERFQQEYLSALELEKEARKPLNRLFTLLEESSTSNKVGDVYLNPALEEYRIKLEQGNEEALDRLVDPEKTSIYDQALDEIDADQETREEAEFYKKLAAENYNFLQAAIDRKINLEDTMRYSLKTARNVDDKILQASSLLIGPLNHGEIGNLTGETQKRFLENTQIEEDEIAEIAQEIITNWRISGESRAEKKFQESIEKARGYWHQSS